MSLRGEAGDLLKKGDRARRECFFRFLEVAPLPQIAAPTSPCLNFYLECFHSAPRTVDDLVFKLFSLPDVELFE